MATIAMPLIGLGGHVGPAIRVAGVLRSQGHEVIVWAPERYRQQTESSGAEFREHEPATTRAPFPTLVEFAAVLALATESCVGALIDEIHRVGADLVVHDIHVPWARVAADFLGLPRVVTNPLFPVEESRHVDWWRWASRRPGVPPPTEEALRRVQQSGEAVASAWGVELGDWWRTMRNPARRMISFTTEEILGGPPPVDFTCVGPLVPKLPRAAPESGRPLVYVAFGTFFNADHDPFRTTIDALADEPVDVILSTGGGLVAAEDLGPLPDNVTAHEFVDSREVLSRAAVHVTHGGGSSVHESLLAGVPMVCVPQGSDQAAWAGCAERLGAARITEQSPMTIRATVREVLENGRFSARAGEVGDRLASFDGETKVEELVAQATLGAAS